MGEVTRFRKELEKALLDNNADAAMSIIFEHMADMPPLDRVHKVIAPVLEEIGVDWWKGQTSLSQVYFSSKVCEEAVIKLIGEGLGSFPNAPKVAVATLEDYHLLGSKVVRMSMQSAGQKVIDYGRMDVPGLIDKVCEDKVEYLLISTLMLRSALKVKELVHGLDAKGCEVKVIVGGAPFRFDWGLWKRVDADFTASSPLMALEFIRREEEL